MSKIDLIIEALERANELWLTEPMGEKALAASRELKAELAEPRIPAKIIGPNLEAILNAAGFYRCDAVCCGDYEKCIQSCTPRGRWLAEKKLRKEWVGLTDDEIWECQKLGLSDDVYKAIEAALRSKNT
jgi:hypothetical protein